MEEILSTTPDGPYIIPRTAEQWAKEQLRDRDLREAIALLRGQELPEPRARRHLAPRVRSLLDLVPLLYLDPGSGALRLKKRRRPAGGPHHPYAPGGTVGAASPRARRTPRGMGEHLHPPPAGLCPVRRRHHAPGSGDLLAVSSEAGEQRPQRHTYRTVVSGFPFQRISIDFVGPLRPTKAGNTCILTVKDTFTKWVEAFPMRAARAEEAASLLIGEVFARYGYPDEVHSDRGTQFTGKIMRQLGDLIGYSITWTPTYHPQSNPVERAHRDLKAGLRAALETVGGQEWDLCLPQILFAFRCAPARGTGLSPFETLFGRLPNIPIGAIDPPPTSGRPLAEYVTKLRGRILDVHRVGARQPGQRGGSAAAGLPGGPKGVRGRGSGVAVQSGTAERGKIRKKLDGALGSSVQAVAGLI
jgi:transposase InsO family protein